jgi:hypothetical protein
MICNWMHLCRHWKARILLPPALPHAAHRFIPRVDRLEERVLLSGGSSLLPQLSNTPDLRVVASFGGIGVFPATGGGTTSPTGFSPAQIRQAYGFNLITFGTVIGDGSGQTIAVVDAYHDPNIADDLLQFDARFGLSNPKFSELYVDKNGNPTTTVPVNAPKTGADAGWDGEISLDVQWSHAAAPGANILLVECGNSSDASLEGGVHLAAQQPGVVVVSSSWGDTESSSETMTDATAFSTPSGHGGVTFVASAGDTGSAQGVEYPAASPNVLSVGGTSLTLNGSNYGSETVWSNSYGSTGGGLSTVEAEPAYQQSLVPSALTTQWRAVPDVAFDADPNTGVSVYDSYIGGTTPWFVYGGTSLGAPVWAGLVAVADQGRILAGLTSLDGPSQTLPMIYAMQSTAFHDVTTGGNGTYNALAGYDLVTGRGSPYANLVAANLSQFSGKFQISSQPPTCVTPGNLFSVTVTAENSAGTVLVNYNGTVTLSLGNNPGNGTLSGTTTLNFVNGTATFTNLSINNPGMGYTLQAAGGGFAAAVSNAFDVSTAMDFTVSAATPQNAGAAFNFTVTALDQFGNVATNYSGAIAFTSSDGKAILPSLGTLNAGTGSFNATLKTAGKQTITATDTLTTSITGTSGAVTVSSGAPYQLVFGQQPTNVLSTQVISPAVTVQVLDAFGNLVDTDNNDTVTLGIFSGPSSGQFTGSSTTAQRVVNGVATFSNLGFTAPGTYKLTEFVTGFYTGPVSSAFTVTPLQVSSFSQTSTGFALGFNKPFVPGVINLYDAFNTFGAADVTLVGATNGPIEGSLLINPAATSITFVATNFGGVPAAATLLPDTYTVTLRSASNGFQDANGGLLDGNGDGTPGDNYVNTFTVAASAAVVVTVPDFARGPGQVVNVPATGVNGIPINIGNASGVTSVSFTLTYDPTLLTITGGFTSVTGASLNVNVTTPGTAQVTFGQFTGTVPQTAPYQAKDLLHFSSVAVNGGALPSVGGDAVHVVAFFGDAAANESVNAFDAALLTRVALGLDTGFAAYPNTDPHTIGDINGDGRLTSADATLLLRASVGTTVAQLPAIPTGFTIVQGGPDPTVSLPSHLNALPGGTLVVPVNIDDPAPAGSTGMVEATLALTYDPGALTLTSSDIHLGSVPLSGLGWQLVDVVDASTGQIGITLFSAAPIMKQTGGSLVTIDFQVEPAATLASTPVMLVDSVNPSGSAVIRTGVDQMQGGYTLNPTATTVTIIGIAPTTAVLAIVDALQPVVTMIGMSVPDLKAVPSMEDMPNGSAVLLVEGVLPGIPVQPVSVVMTHGIPKAELPQLPDSLPVIPLDSDVPMTEEDPAKARIESLIPEPFSGLLAGSFARTRSPEADAFTTEKGAVAINMQLLDGFFASEAAAPLCEIEDNFS